MVERKKWKVLLGKKLSSLPQKSTVSKRLFFFVKKCEWKNFAKKCRLVA